MNVPDIQGDHCCQQRHRGQKPAFLRKIKLPSNIPIVMVNSGASVQRLGLRGVPDDVTVQCGVDRPAPHGPLAELVRSIPRQSARATSDVDQAALKQSLDDVVIS